MRPVVPAKDQKPCSSYLEQGMLRHPHVIEPVVLVRGTLPTEYGDTTVSAGFMCLAPPLITGTTNPRPVGCGSRTMLGNQQPLLPHTLRAIYNQIHLGLSHDEYPNQDRSTSFGLSRARHLVSSPRHQGHRSGAWNAPYGVRFSMISTGVARQRMRPSRGTRGGSIREPGVQGLSPWLPEAAAISPVLRYPRL